MSEYLSNNNDTALQIAFRSLILKPDADGYMLIAKIYKIIEMSESVSFSVEKKEAKRNNIHIFPLDSDDAWVDMNYLLTGLCD